MDNRCIPLVFPRDALDINVGSALERLCPLGLSLLGAAVSGGADSSAMLLSLCRIAKERGFFIRVITVNHNMRAKEESAGDVESVVLLCKRLFNEGYPVSCRVEEIERGEVERIAAVRMRGEEEAARFLRYRVLAKVAKEEDIKYIALAHNKNDQLETLLMRFFQGASLTGIRQIRKYYIEGEELFFIRPLLMVSRGEIEEYLAKYGITYRTDSTNYDTRYLRNKTRHILIPMLNNTIPGWQKAVLFGSMKAIDDDAVLRAAANNVLLARENDMLYITLDTFNAQARAVRGRLVLRFFNELGVDDRVPYKSVLQAIGKIERIGGVGKAVVTDKRKKRSIICCFGIEIGVEGRGEECIVYARKQKKAVTDKGFCVIIRGEGKYETPLGTLLVAEDGEGRVSLQLKRGNVLCGLKVPLCVRSRSLSDTVETLGGHKSVASLLSDWKVQKDIRDSIPIVAECAFGGEETVCVWGSAAGYTDYRCAGVTR